MKTIKEAQQKEAGQYMYLLVNGIKLYNFGGYDSKIDLKKGIILSIADNEYKSSILPTINELIKTGKIKEISELREYEVYPKMEEDTFDLDSVIEEFKNHGFNVTEESLAHNYGAWRVNCKSGFKGDDFFLFTPTGENKLVFRACDLLEGAQWQITYIA